MVKLPKKGNSAPQYGNQRFKFNELEFNVGDNVLAAEYKEHKATYYYPAKILKKKVNEKTKKYDYFIHYKNFNKRNDWWIEGSLVEPDTQEKRDLLYINPYTKENILHDLSDLINKKPKVNDGKVKGKDAKQSKQSKININLAVISGPEQMQKKEKTDEAPVVTTQIEDDFTKYTSKQMESFHNMQFPELHGYLHAAWVQENHAKMRAYIEDVASRQKLPSDGGLNVGELVNCALKMDMFEKYSKGLNHHHVAKNLSNGRMIDIKTDTLYNSTKLPQKYKEKSKGAKYILFLFNSLYTAMCEKSEQQKIQFKRLFQNTDFFCDEKVKNDTNGVDGISNLTNSQSNRNKFVTEKAANQPTPRRTLRRKTLHNYKQLSHNGVKKEAKEKETEVIRDAIYLTVNKNAIVYFNNKHKHGNEKHVSQELYKNMSKNSEYKCAPSLPNDVMCCDQFLQRCNTDTKKLSDLMCMFHFNLVKKPKTDPRTNKFLKPVKASHLYGLPHLVEFLNYLPAVVAYGELLTTQRIHKKRVVKAANMITRFLIKNIESVQGRIQHMKQDSPTSPPCKSAVASDPPPQDPMISETPAKPPQTSKNLPASLQRKRGRPRKQEQVSNGEVADQDEAPDAKKARR